MKESSKKKARILFFFESFQREKPRISRKFIRVKVPFTPPSYGEKFISTFITATVWAGVLVTLPLTFFWVFKKEKENEKILVRRLGNGSKLFSGPKTNAGKIRQSGFEAKTELIKRKASR